MPWERWGDIRALGVLTMAGGTSLVDKQLPPRGDIVNGGGGVGVGVGPAQATPKSTAALVSTATSILTRKRCKNLA